MVKLVNFVVMMLKKHEEGKKEINTAWYTGVFDTIIFFAGAYFGYKLVDMDIRLNMLECKKKGK